MSRLFLGALLTGCLAFGFSLSASADEAADKGKKCTIAVKGDNDVVKACQAGGIPRAKAVMKSMQKAAKGKGMKVDCDSCHKNETDWTLTADGEEQFKKMAALLKG